MDDKAIVQRINELADEEHALERSLAGRGGSEEEQGRLRDLEESLDQCWDLLRQRRARRSAGQDPEDAAARPTEVVEHYQQ